MIKAMAATAVLLILVGCEQQYRYPCHNPDNWDTPRCQKPLCEINKDCPEHILKGTNGNGNSAINFNNLKTTETQCNNKNNVSKSDQKGACR
jgi:hypothetical protein